MICPKCSDADKTSKLRQEVKDTSISFGDAPADVFYDEEGRLHQHESTEIQTVWVCCNKHRVRRIFRTACAVEGCSHEGKDEVTALDP
jgi:hypothetical protein